MLEEETQKEGYARYLRTGSAHFVLGFVIGAIIGIVVYRLVS